MGSTKNLVDRLDDHNNSRSTYTKRGKPWVLKWDKPFETRAEAYNAEMKIKRMKSRKYIEALISSR